jgi:hypothetical protein
MAPECAEVPAESREPDVELIDEILAEWQPVIGADFAGYRNHVIRMAGFCFALRECTDEERQKVHVAACFHDIGIWTAGTLDYLPPSVPPAVDYLGRLLSGALCGCIRNHTALSERAIDDGFLDELDRYWLFIDAEHTRRLTRRGTHATGELREVIGGVKRRQGGFWSTSVDVIVPVGDEVV